MRWYSLEMQLRNHRIKSPQLRENWACVACLSLFCLFRQAMLTHKQVCNRSQADLDSGVGMRDAQANERDFFSPAVLQPLADRLAGPATRYESAHSSYRDGVQQAEWLSNHFGYSDMLLPAQWQA